MPDLGYVLSRLQKDKATTEAKIKDLLVQIDRHKNRLQMSIAVQKKAQEMQQVRLAVTLSASWLSSAGFGQASAGTALAARRAYPRVSPAAVLHC